MNRIKNALVTTSLFCLLAVSTVSADDMKHHQTLTFDKAVMINNTLVKKGTYRVTFDVQKREVKFKDAWDGDVVLVTAAHVETLPEEADYDAVTTSETEAGTVLQKLLFEGHEEAAIFNTENALASVAHNQVPTNNNFSQQDWLYPQLHTNDMNSYHEDVIIEETYEGTPNKETSDEEEMYRD